MYAIKTLSAVLSTLDFLLPEKCALCQRVSNLGFCIHCQKLLPWSECVCEVCGIHLHEPGVCGRCQTCRPVYQDSVIPFRYQSPIADQIQALKYSAQLSYAVAMGKMLSLWIAKRPVYWQAQGQMQGQIQWPEVIVPMPLHRKRITQRGFNQATEIARVLSKQLGIPINHTLLKRVKNTVPQTGLNAKMRQQNMMKAFVGQASIEKIQGEKTHTEKTKTGKNASSYRHVVLLDDVVTSGSTVNAAAKALLDAGVERVSVWAIAKT